MLLLNFVEEDQEFPLLQEKSAADGYRYHLPLKGTVKLLSHGACLLNLVIVD